MGKTVAGLLGFIGGMVLGYCIVLFGWVTYTNLFDVADLGGGKAMGIAFFFAPVGGVILGIIGAVWLTRRVGRKADATARM
jgi:hypothetical protein